MQSTCIVVLGTFLNLPEHMAMQDLPPFACSQIETNNMKAANLQTSDKRQQVAQ